MKLLFCLRDILSTCSFVNSPFYQLDTFLCHFICLLFYQIAVFKLLFCKLVVLSCCFVNLLFCQLAVLSTCCLLNLPFYQLDVLSIYCVWMCVSICVFVMDFVNACPFIALCLVAPVILVCTTIFGNVCIALDVCIF